jgi:hypothetical protein
MTLYATTAVPSLNLLGGVETLQRILQPHTEITNVAWDEEHQTTVAVLKTNGEHNCLEAVAEVMQRFQVPLIESKDLIDAIHTAKVMANTHELVEIGDYKIEDSYSL